MVDRYGRPPFLHQCLEFAACTVSSLYCRWFTRVCGSVGVLTATVFDRRSAHMATIALAAGVSGCLHCKMVVYWQLPQSSFVSYGAVL
ncbi:hypothetical protein NDU88_004234 [Pleurodeles waltl]|uniref:Uncharacterized protein n=1 Tax=Pleurodeles waltl TaxID=8319 RepID=A0AAV7M8Q6_PLEWA|nr:hypothetical protein NDU88_004234 [Pleurodeles waltl]